MSNPKLLWSGSWSSGSITVTDSGNYKVLMYMYGSYPGFLVRNGNTLEGGSTALANSVSQVNALSATISGNTITMAGHRSNWEGGGSMDLLGVVQITEIYGIILTDDIET